MMTVDLYWLNDDDDDGDDDNDDDDDDDDDDNDDDDDDDDDDWPASTQCDISPAPPQPRFFAPQLRPWNQEFNICTTYTCLANSIHICLTNTINVLEMF